MEVLSYILLGALIAVACYIAIPALSGSPWWPAPKREVIKLLRMAELKEGETLYDLGCGDGRALIAAAREFGARGVGVEIDPVKVFIARFLVKSAGLSDRIKILRSSVLDVPLTDADVVFLYLSHQLIDRMKDKFLTELKPEARIASYGFMVRGFPLYKTAEGLKGFIYKMSLGRNLDRYT